MSKHIFSARFIKFHPSDRQLDRPSFIVSHELVYVHDQATSSRKLCDRVDTWRALACTRRASPYRARVLVRTSWYSNKSAVCYEHVQQNVLERAKSSDRANPSEEFFERRVSTTYTYLVSWNRKRSTKKNRAVEEMPLSRCILIRTLYRWSLVDEILGTSKSLSMLQIHSTK